VHYTALVQYFSHNLLSISKLILMQVLASQRWWIPSFVLHNSFILFLHSIHLVFCTSAKSSFAVLIIIYQYCFASCFTEALLIAVQIVCQFPVLTAKPIERHAYRTTLCVEVVRQAQSVEPHLVQTKENYWCF